MTVPQWDPQVRSVPAMSADGASGRIQSLDTLRGFALFGIILVNAPFFAAPLGEILPATLADTVVA
jgi:uncharacterized membrane protein YeiB